MILCPCTSSTTRTVGCPAQPSSDRNAASTPYATVDGQDVYPGLSTGGFAEETVVADQGIRPDTSLEKLAANIEETHPTIMFVVPRLFDHGFAYFFQLPDGRIFFALPYERDFTLIGTTDQDYEGDPGKTAITDTEIDYLCAAASELPVKNA